MSSQPTVTEASRRKATGAAAGARHVRVDLRRLDAIMNLVGELTTAQNRLLDLAGEAGGPGPGNGYSQRSRTWWMASRTKVIQARMAPVSQIFDRFPSRGARCRAQPQQALVSSGHRGA